MIPPVGKIIVNAPPAPGRSEIIEIRSWWPGKAALLSRSFAKALADAIVQAASDALATARKGRRAAEIAGCYTAAICLGDHRALRRSSCCDSARAAGAISSRLRSDRLALEMLLPPRP